jgi:hypothetical protein
VNILIAAIIADDQGVIKHEDKNHFHRCIEFSCSAVSVQPESSSGVTNDFREFNRLWQTHRNRGCRWARDGYLR